MYAAHKLLTTASALAIASLISLGSVNAAEKMKPGMQDQPSANQEDCVTEGTCAPDAQGQRPSRVDEDNQDQNANSNPKKRRASQNQDNDQDMKSSHRASNDWKYDPDKHQRRRHKDARYKYFYGGYWYLEPYWTVGVYGPRISCGEGRAIVDDSGFYRVRVIECSGRNFTYAASRHGNPYRVVLNSRTGDIVSVRPL